MAPAPADAARIAVAHGKVASIMTAAPAWRDLRVRVVSATVIAPIGLGALWLGGWKWQVLIVLLAVGMVTEWVTISRCLRERAGGRSARTLLIGLCWIIPATIALIWMRDDRLVGRENVLFILLVVWASDIGAYLVGRLVGGPRLAPLISPGKTWSGAVGGLTSACLVGVAAVSLGGHGAILYGAAVAGGLGIAAQLGDLLESVVKRQFGVKDSGTMIPGHGGLLDRLDGMLLAAPLAALLILAFGRGVTLW